MVNDKKKEYYALALNGDALAALTLSTTDRDVEIVGSLRGED